MYSRWCGSWKRRCDYSLQGTRCEEPTEFLHSRNFNFVAQSLIQRTWINSCHYGDKVLQISLWNEIKNCTRSIIIIQVIPLIEPSFVTQMCLVCSPAIWKVGKLTKKSTKAGKKQLVYQNRSSAVSPPQDIWCSSRYESL